MIRKHRSGQVLVPKTTFFSVLFAVFAGTAHQLMVPAKPCNTHPKPHLMQKEPTDLLNFPRPLNDYRGSKCHSVLYNRYSNPVVLMAIQMVTGPRAVQNARPLFLFPIESEISTPENTNGHWSKGYTKHLTPCLYIQ